MSIASTEGGGGWDMEERERVRGRRKGGGGLGQGGKRDWKEGEREGGYEISS